MSNTVSTGRESAKYNLTVLRTQDTGPVADKIIGRWRNKQRNKPLGVWAPGHYTKVGISDVLNVSRGKGSDSLKMFLRMLIFSRSV
jgi:hypothetical protein